MINRRFAIHVVFASGWLCSAAGCDAISRRAGAEQSAIRKAAQEFQFEVSSAVRASLDESRPSGISSATHAVAPERSLLSQSAPHDAETAALIAELLRPQEVPELLLPRTEQPTPWRTLALDQMALAPAPLPGATIDRGPRFMQQDRNFSVPALPALDAPPLATGLEQVRPGRAELFAGPKIRAASPEQQVLLPLGIVPRPPPTPGLNDPTADAARQALLSQAAQVRVADAPFAAINIPDPEEHLRGVELRNPPSDVEPQLTPLVLPERPSLQPK